MHFRELDFHPFFVSAVVLQLPSDFHLAVLFPIALAVALPTPITIRLPHDVMDLWLDRVVGPSLEFLWEKIVWRSTWRAASGTMDRF